MRVVAVLIVAAGLAAAATALANAAPASHRAARTTTQNATVPSWSPDGKQIAFAYPSPERYKRYRIVRTSSKPGGAIHTVLAAKGYCCRQLQWAAGGRILVIPDVGLKSVRVQTGKPKRLFFPGCSSNPGGWCQVEWFLLSPNRTIAAVKVSEGGDPHGPQGFELVRLRRGQDPVVLTTLQPEDGEPLAFSPDSRQLVFRGASGLMALPVDGGDSVPLTQSGIPGASRVPTDVQQVQWSPDGGWVAYVEVDDTAGNWKLEVVPTTSASTPRELVSCAGGLGFSWSPTSKLVTYACSTDRLMTVRLDGTHLANLLKGRHLYAPGPTQWSPDGSRLLFVAGPFSFTQHVWTVRANGRNLTRRS